MKHIPIILMIAAVSFIACAADPSADPKADAYPQGGTWKPISAVLGGVKLPKAAVDAITLRVSGADYEVTVVGERAPDRGTHKLDESTTPKRITITSTNGPNKGKAFLGIYEVMDTNSMRVCYDLSGTEFPKEFKAPEGTQFYLVEYRRHEPRSYPQDGVWKPIGAILGGEKLPRPALDAITLRISGPNYELTVNGEKEPDRGTRKLDESTTPKRITLVSTNGPNKGKTFLGIFEMKDANSMRICYDLSGTEFPKEFNAPKGTQLYLVGYRRQSDSTPATPERK